MKYKYEINNFHWSINTKIILKSQLIKRRTLIIYLFLSQIGMVTGHRYVLSHPLHPPPFYNGVKFKLHPRLHSDIFVHNHTRFYFIVEVKFKPLPPSAFGFLRPHMHPFIYIKL